VRTRAILPVVVIGLAAVASQLDAQQRRRFNCRDHDDDWGDRFCEIKEQMIQPGRGVIRVNAHPNGGVSVVGWDRNQIELRAEIRARARSEERAAEIGGEVEIVVTGTEISAEGPRTRGREWWSVNFELRVPRNSDLWVRAHNGGIDVTQVKGEIDLETLNGGLVLQGMAGTVRGETTNGGVDVELEGARWDGIGLDVRTINGGVDLSVPDRYSADLETGTVNGGIDIDFPVQVRGRLNKRIHTKLGDGGPPIRVVTTNGGVSIRRG